MSGGPTFLAVAAAALVAVAVLVAPGAPQRPHTSARRVRLAVPGSRSAGALSDPPAPPAPVSVDSLLAVVELVATQVRAGAAPALAWCTAVELETGRPQVVGDPARSLRGMAREGRRRRTSPEAEDVARAAAAAAAGWELAQRTGAPLAEVLDCVAATLRAEREDRAAVQAALAGPRATARLLTGLPLAGVALGQLIGADSVHVLTGTPSGRLCALLGVGLLLVGRWWMAWLVRSVLAGLSPGPGR